MTQEDHFDVASYALGVLDAREAARFEDHLLVCERCAFELESFVQVADLLSEVDPSAVIAAEESRREGIMLQQMMGEVRVERRRANSRRLYSLAAAVVIFAMLSIGAFFVGGQLGADKAPAATAANPHRSSNSSQFDPLPESGLGIGGTALPGESHDNTDPRTGVAGAVGLEKKDWGTQIFYAVSHIKGPKKCQLVITHANGTSETVSSWTVGEQGWGTPDRPEALMLAAATATPREDIAHVLVEEVTATGETNTLVRIL